MQGWREGMGAVKIKCLKAISNMLTFDENGFLTPTEIIPATLELVENEFVTMIGTAPRRRLFENLIKYLYDLKALVGEEIIVWINGSYATKKPNPADIDIVAFVPWRKMEELSFALKPFTYPAAFGNYGVDGYLVRVYEPSHKNYILTHSDRLHWLHDFCRTQPNRQGKTFKKGFLEIRYLHENQRIPHSIHQGLG